MIPRFLPAEISERHLARLRLVEDDGERTVMLCADLHGDGALCLFFPRAHIAALLFPSTETARAICAAVGDARAVGR